MSDNPQEMYRAPTTRTALIWAMAEAIARERPRCRTTHNDCTPHMGCTCYKQAVSALAAITAAGCRVVPVQPTLTMKEGSSVHFALEELEYENIHKLWKSMVNGSPFADTAAEAVAYHAEEFLDRLEKRWPEITDMDELRDNLLKAISELRLL